MAECGLFLPPNPNGIDSTFSKSDFAARTAVPVFPPAPMMWRSRTWCALICMQVLTEILSKREPLFRNSRRSAAWTYAVIVNLVQPTAEPASISVRGFNRWSRKNFIWPKSFLRILPELFRPDFTASWTWNLLSPCWFPRRRWLSPNIPQCVSRHSSLLNMPICLLLRLLPLRSFLVAGMDRCFPRFFGFV